MVFLARRPAARTDASPPLRKNRQRAVVALLAVLATGVLVRIGWSAWHLNDADMQTSEQRMQQRLGQLHAQDGALFHHKVADHTTSGPPLPALPRQPNALLADNGLGAPSSFPERLGAVDALREPLSPLEDGSIIAVPKRLHPTTPLTTINSQDRTRSTAGSPATASMQLTGDGFGMPADGSQPAGDAGKPKIDGAQLASAAQPTGAGQAAGGQGAAGGQAASGGQSAGGSQGAGGEQGAGGGQAADAGAPPADGNQPTGNGNQTGEVINIQAADMQLDPAHAHLHQGDGEVFMFSNSSLNAQFDLNSPALGLSIFARADKANGEWPQLTVSVDGTVIQTVTVNSTVEKKFYVPLSVDPGQVNLQLSYTNDFFDPSTHQDRNVYVGHIKVVAQGSPGQ